MDEKLDKIIYLFVTKSIGSDYAPAYFYKMAENKSKESFDEKSMDWLRNRIQEYKWTSPKKIVYTFLLFFD